jgi:hypothetical protein
MNHHRKKTVSSGKGRYCFLSGIRNDLFELVDNTKDCGMIGIGFVYPKAEEWSNKDGFFLYSL